MTNRKIDKPVPPPMRVEMRGIDRRVAFVLLFGPFVVFPILGLMAILAG